MSTILHAIADPSTIEDLFDVLTGKAIGRSICHVWYDADTRLKEVHCGLVGKVKRERSNKYVVAYWAKDESEDTAVDYDVSKFALAADLVCGDLKLCF